MSRQGFTLIEVLVAMAIMGTIFVLILNWQTNTLQITTRSNAMAGQLQDMNDLTGYVGDRVRSARAIRLTGLTVNAASAPNAGLCDTTTPCLAVLTMDEDITPATTTTPQKYKTTWLRLVFRVEARSAWSGADKLDDPWADDPDNKIVIIREYRDKCEESLSTVSITQPTSACSTFYDSFNSAAFSGMNPQLVADGLSAVDQDGATIVPFATNAAGSVSPGNPVVLTFQAKRSTRGQVTYIPAGAPARMEVQPRNLAP